MPTPLVSVWRVASLAAGLAAATLLAGCSSETSGTPQAGGQPPSDSGLPHSGAPKVENPIDTKAFEAEPCSMITDQQLSKAEIPIEDAKPDLEALGGPTCTWYPPIDWGQIGVTLLTVNTGGLSDIYAKNDPGDWEYFEPVLVEAYPAIFYSRLDARDRGYCTVGVGVRDDLELFLHIQLRDESQFYKNPCKGAETLAGLAIQTMTGGS